MSRIESGSVRIEYTTVHLPDILHDLRTIIQGSVYSKQQDLYIDTQDVFHEEDVYKRQELNDVSVTFATKQLRFEAEDPEAVLPKIRETIQSMEPDVEVVERTRGKRKTAEHHHEHHEHGHEEGCGCGHDHHHEHHDHEHSHCLLYTSLNKIGVPILGTSAENVDAAEDRELFDEILEKCCIPRPKGGTVFTKEEAIKTANEIGYPVLIRPSYVLGGQGMQIAISDEDISEFMDVIQRYAQEHPILIDKYLMGVEVEVDAVCDGEEIVIPGSMQHVERAGIHSGDSISVYPARDLSLIHIYPEIKDEEYINKAISFEQSLDRYLSILFERAGENIFERINTKIGELQQLIYGINIQRIEGVVEKNEITQEDVNFEEAIDRYLNLWDMRRNENDCINRILNKIEKIENIWSIYEVKTTYVPIKGCLLYTSCLLCYLPSTSHFKSLYLSRMY